MDVLLHQVNKKKKIAARLRAHEQFKFFGTVELCARLEQIVFALYCVLYVF